MKVKLLIGVTVCVAAVAALTVFRGGGGARASLTVGEDNPSSVQLQGANPPAGKPATTPTASLNGKLAERLTRISTLSFDQQTHALQEVAQQIPIEDIQTVLAALEGSPKRSLDSEFGLMLLTRWAHLDAKAASNWVQEHMEGSSRQQGLNAVALARVQTDRDGAIEWAKALPEGTERGEVMVALAYEIGRDNAEAALALLDDLPSGREREEVTTHLASIWASASPSEALEWAAKLPADELRLKAIAAVAVAWADNNPTSAGTLAVNSLPEGSVQDYAVMGVVQRWVQKEPMQAAAWVTAFPESPLRDTAVEELVKLWTNQDPAQAGQWLNSLAAGQIHDVAVGAYAGTIAVTHPKTATEWLNNIADDNLRYDEMERVAELWLSNDPNSARAWIAEAQLPETRKAKLLESRRE